MMRSRNVEIILRRVTRKCPLALLPAAIDSLDTSSSSILGGGDEGVSASASMKNENGQADVIPRPSERLGLEAVIGLRQCLPTVQEAAALRRWLAVDPVNHVPTRLVRAEEFFCLIASMAGGTVSAGQKLAALEFNLNLRDSLQRLDGALNSIQMACAQVTSSPRLGRLLLRVRDIGNTLNKAQFRAQGFRLHSLLRLRETRTFVDENANILHFLVAEALAGGDDDTIEVAADMPAIGTAKRWVLGAIRQEIQDLRRGLRALEKQAETTDTSTNTTSSNTTSNSNCSVDKNETMRRCVAEAQEKIAAVDAKFTETSRMVAKLLHYLGEEADGRVLTHTAMNEQPAALLGCLWQFFGQIKCARGQHKQIQRCLDVIEGEV